MFTLDLSEENFIETTINADGGSFTLTLQQPSFEDKLGDDTASVAATAVQPERYSELTKQRFLKRLDRVIDWSGVSDPAGNAIPFSRTGLLRLISKSASISEQVGQELARLYGGQSLEKPASSV